MTSFRGRHSHDKLLLAHNGNTNIQLKLNAILHGIYTFYSGTIPLFLSYSLSPILDVPIFPHPFQSSSLVSTHSLYGCTRSPIPLILTAIALPWAVPLYYNFLHAARRSRAFAANPSIALVPSLSGLLSAGVTWRFGPVALNPRAADAPASCADATLRPCGAIGVGMDDWRHRKGPQWGPFYGQDCFACQDRVFGRETIPAALVERGVSNTFQNCVL